MNSTSTLTDRYVDATLHRLPARQRADIEKELRASILDAVEDRIEAGAETVEAERAVLTEFGDPARLAAGYTDRPLHLIGPALFLEYKRLVGALLVTVVPAVAVGVGAAGILHDDTTPHVLGDTVAAAVTTAVHIGFWTTLVFALVERTSVLGWTPARPWTLDALPEPPGRRTRFGELVAQAVLLVLVAAALLLSPILSPHTDAAGEPVGVLPPALWDDGILYVLIGLAVAGLGLAVARRFLRFRMPLVVATAVVKLGASGVMIALAGRDRLVNPAFAAAADWPASATQWANTAVTVIGVIGVAYTIVETIVWLSTRSWRTPGLGARIRTVVDGISGARTR